MIILAKFAYRDREIRRIAFCLSQALQPPLAGIYTAEDYVGCTSCCALFVKVVVCCHTSFVFLVF